MTILSPDDKNTAEIFRVTIEKSKSIIILTHVNPDGDAIGSALGLTHYLKLLNKNPQIIIHGALAGYLKFLPGADEIITYTEEHYPAFQSADLLIVLDLNDCRRLKSIEKAFTDSKAQKILIDHHIEPLDFADINIIDTHAAATAEILYKLMTANAAPALNTDIAICLYCGIMTDTGGFRFSNTNEEILSIAAHLVRLGANPSMEFDEVYCTMSLPSLKLLGLGFSTMETYFDGKLVVMKLYKESFEQCGAVEEDMENFAEELLILRGVKVGILMAEIEERNEIRVSFRAKEGYNVRQVAAYYGGGGHLQAAGARLQNSTIDEELPGILERIKDCIK
jgi:phosphoesterase RecJ-like protein